MGLLTAAAAALFVYGTDQSIQASNRAKNTTDQAREQSRTQFAAEQKRADVQNVRNVRQQIRQAHIARSSMANVGAQTGGAGGSAVAGGVSSVGSQLSSNLHYMSQIATQNTAIGKAQLGYSGAMADASIAGAEAQQWSNVAAMGSSAFTTFGGPAAVAKYLT